MAATTVANTAANTAAGHISVPSIAILVNVAKMPPAGVKPPYMRDWKAAAREPVTRKRIGICLLAKVKQEGRKGVASFFCWGKERKRRRSYEVELPTPSTLTSAALSSWLFHFHLHLLCTLHEELVDGCGEAACAGEVGACEDDVWDVHCALYCIFCCWTDPDRLATREPGASGLLFMHHPPTGNKTTARASRKANSLTSDKFILYGG
ncbi:hypothetical protein T310_7244 [Rasamsonia emersonii CBS 393.64]|uniref:Uncharacterized protein n=1 Tax=Rasamsonia emersonii (strain ATCC 16479 / CBS 393.64 / IMI 116815) TaxID=1408163 RepID=A0A0F4YKQ0_RASE3|nr:hypothetical protein T310_7244 [Rasamsonia emersonii CBS 393.64]KKA18804.1 hypothetical protein T310_7244 [Rasamsonia emersonii CBS 393.64]